MRRILLVSLVGAIMGLLLVAYAVPAFAQRVGVDAADPGDAVRQACIAACGGDVSNMPCGGGGSMMRGRNAVLWQ